MAVTQLVLTGMPAFVGAVRGPTRVGFFIDETEFDPAKLIEVDLDKNPATVAPASWATGVDVDYQTTGGWTTIGPSFHGGATVGGVYLAERLVTQYASVLASWPPQSDAMYQHQAVLRDNNGTVTRYHGFKVRVISPGAGTLAHLGFIPAGASSPTGGVHWIDLADASMCDPQANGFTTVTPTSPVGTDGALFLTSGGMTTLSKPAAKYPRSQGW